MMSTMFYLHLHLTFTSHIHSLLGTTKNVRMSMIITTVHDVKSVSSPSTSHVHSFFRNKKKIKNILKEWLFLCNVDFFPQPVTLLQLCGPDMLVIYPLNFSGNGLSKLNLTTCCKQLSMNHT